MPQYLTTIEDEEQKFDWESDHFSDGDRVLIVANTNESLNRIGEVGVVVEADTYLSRVHVEGRDNSNNWTLHKEIRYILNEQGTDLVTINAKQAYELRIQIKKDPSWKDFRSNNQSLVSNLGTIANTIKVAEKMGYDVEHYAKTNTLRKLEPVEIVLEQKETTHMTTNTSLDLAAQQLAAALAQNIGVDETAVRKIVHQEIKPLQEAIQTPKIVLMRDKVEVGELPKVRHPMAETLLKSLSSKTADNTFMNVWISGPAGSGKTFAVKQVAEALKIEYGFHGAMTMAHELVGFVDAAGNYHETVFVRLYRNGGVCLLDECDAGSSEALLALNAALANGQMSLPTGEIINRHPDFRCVAAANTFGLGGTAEYVGRARIDAAFLDRFGVKLAWGYDEKLEKIICGDAKWAEYVQKARKKAVAKGLKVMITPRASVAGAALVAAGMSFKEAAEITFLAGMTPDQKKMLDMAGGSAEF